MTYALRFLFWTALGAVVSWFFSDQISEKGEVVNAIISVFSILAAFLIAVVVMLFDPALTSKMNWSIRHLYMPTVQRRLARQQLLFLILMFTLLFAVLSLLTADNGSELERTVEKIFAFLAVLSFGLSASLPFDLAKVQRDRMTSEVGKDTPKVLEDL